jgi:hypothetical protein
MADPAQIVADPDFLAASPQMKQAILAKHDPDFAAASPEMQMRIVAKYGPGQRGGLISGADRVTTLPPATETTISNPPGAMDYVKAGLRQAAETVLPTAGLIGGGAAGLAVSGGNPVAGVGGAGLGYAAGESANRVIGSLARGGDPRPRFSHATDEATRVAGDFLTGMTLDMLPPVVLGAGRRGFDLLKSIIGLGEPTAETMAIRAAAQRQGIDLPAGAASGSTPVSTIESIPGRFPIGRQASEPTFTRLQLQAQRAAERLQSHPEMGPEGVEQAGLAVKREVGDIARAQVNAPTELVDRYANSLTAAPPGRIAAGTALREGMQGSQRAVRAQAAELYDAARATAPPDAAVPLTQTLEVASRIGALESRLGALGNRARGPATTIEGMTRQPEVTLGGETVPVSSLPREFVERYGLDQPAPIPLDLATELLKRVRALGRATTNDVEKGQFREIAHALSADIDAYGASVGGNLGASLARAGQFYRDEVARDFAPKSFVRRLIDLEPGTVADRIANLTNPDQVAAVMRQTPPAQLPMVRRMVLDRLRERSIDRATGEVDPAKFESALRAFGEDNLRAVFGNRLGELNAIRQTMQANFGRAAEPLGPGFAATAGNPFDVPMNTAAEKVVNALTVGRIRSVGDFDAVYGTVSPDTQRMIRASVFDNVLRQSFDNTGRFSIERFLTAKNKVSQEIWDRMLTTQPAEALRDLEMVYGRIATHARAASNPSQTSTAVLGPAQILGGLTLGARTVGGYEDTESFSQKLLALLSPYLLGKAVFSGPGQRMLTSQPAPPPQMNSPIETLSRVLGVQLADVTRRREPEPVKAGGAALSGDRR